MEAAHTVLSNAGQQLGKEYRLLRGVGGEVAKLREDLATMNALLRMQSEAEDDGAVDHFVREWMKQLRELAYDTEDSVDLYKLRIKSRPNDGVRAWLEHLLGTLSRRRRLASEISALRARANDIKVRHEWYGVNRDALRFSPYLYTPPAPVLAASASAYAFRPADYPAANHHQVVGIEEQVDTLVERLKARVGEESYLKVFSIVGFGGLGKTTLAIEVCRRLEAEFPYQAMVSVSQAFEPGRDLKALLKRVLQQVAKPKTENERGIKEEWALGEIDGLDDQHLADQLKEIIEDKRYLIVIDDVPTTQAWDAIQYVLPENNCGSRIIVTTRIEMVAKSCSPASVSGHYIHQMEPLKLEDSTKLFLSRAFGSVDTSYPKELEGVMGNILKKCGGLPLAIVSIASILAGHRSSKSKDKWDTVCKSIGSQMESNPTLMWMRHIITLSYNHLPHELKGFMMYLSIFPEDYEIRKDRLLRRWIAEGLVLEKRGMTLMEVAESYFDELVSRNMVEPHFGYNDMVESCRVHLMLLDVMVSKSLESNFVNLLGGQYAAMSYDRIRRLSIQGDDDRRPQGADRHKKKMAGHGIEGMDVEHVRSLSMFQLQTNKLLDHLYKFSLLRVLDLEDCEGLTNHHMRYVCRLYLLRFLSVKGTNISKMPRQVGNLEHLQTLDARLTCLDGLPETMTNLEKLERIEFKHKKRWDVMWNLPRGLSKMKALREVGFALLRNDVQVVQELGELKQLQYIGMSIEDCQDNAAVLQQLGLSLSKMYSLRRLGISNRNSNGKMTFLYNLPTWPRLLRYLRIEGVLDSGLPSWIGSLTYLVEFRIMRARLVDDQLFGVLCKLPNLKSIWMQWKCYNDEVLVVRKNHSFPVLSNLKVTAEMPKVLRFEQGSMAQLETLEMKFKNAQRSIVGIEHLAKLKEVRLSGNKDNPSLHRALDQLKAENMRRTQRFQVVVKYE
ncbi:disease resistance protein Pik-2-like [Phragmites australis]|uniref:disease resistance protein Pik-2-like n=1 Tax=Phragmites australis TaxID=29695 RepID=UPI002D78CDE3|nr:disease resistance protein Pik-2-like [Phragmites australis]